MSQLSHKIITYLFAVACFSFALFFPFLTTLESILGVLILLWGLPYLFIRVVLRSQDNHPLRLFKKGFSRQEIVSIIALLVGATIIAFLFSRMDVLEVYRLELVDVGMIRLLTVSYINIVFFLPFVFAFYVFAYCFLPNILAEHPKKMVYTISSLVFLILFYPVITYAFPETPFWFHFPVILPLLGALLFYKSGRSYIVPLMVIIVNIIYVLFLI